MRTSVALCLAAFLTAFACPAAANPPNAVEAKYDLSRGELLVQVEHIVSDRTSHYIEKVTVSKNGAEVASRSFDSQTSNRNQTLPPFKLRAALGDKIIVDAVCNKWGSRKVTITVE